MHCPYCRHTDTRVLDSRVAEDGGAIRRRRSCPTEPPVGDLDDFKRINDSYGHAAGDQILVRVAERLVGAVRAEDVTGRQSGDEFAVLLTRVRDADEAIVSADRILGELRRPIVLGAHTIIVGGTIGICCRDRARRDSRGPADPGRRRDVRGEGRRQGPSRRLRPVDAYPGHGPSSRRPAEISAWQYLIDDGRSAADARKPRSCRRRTSSRAAAPLAGSARPERRGGRVA